MPDYLYVRLSRLVRAITKFPKTPFFGSIAQAVWPSTIFLSPKGKTDRAERHKDDGTDGGTCPNARATALGR